MRARGQSDGLTRTEAQRAARQLIDAESVRRPPTIDKTPRTVDDAAEQLRTRLAIEGARLSYRQNCESMQRVHISPAIGSRRVKSVTRQDVERLARSMLNRGLKPKTVRNVMTFLHAVFRLALANGWLADHGVLGSVGSVGDAYDNALAESFVDLLRDRADRRLGHPDVDGDS